MRQGEIWWAELPPPVGRRPMLILTRNESCLVRSSITVALVTTTIRNIPTEVPLAVEDGMPKPCVVNVDTIYTIHKDTLKAKQTAINGAKWQAVTHAIKFAFAMN